jgi:GNAT superfamily N-acetyltransferase
VKGEIMLSLVQSNSNDKDFMDLTNQLDAELIKRYGDMQCNYNKFNLSQPLDTVIIAYIDNIPAGCGSFKKYNLDTVEIKRMFVRPEYRGQGISKIILIELEKCAIELGFFKSILETGINQPEAISLYEKSGYSRTANYGQYIGMTNSVCFEKVFEQIKL